MKTLHFCFFDTQDYSFKITNKDLSAISGAALASNVKNAWNFRIDLKRNIQMKRWRIKKVNLPSAGCSLAHWHMNDARNYSVALQTKNEARTTLYPGQLNFVYNPHFDKWMRFAVNKKTLTPDGGEETSITFPFIGINNVNAPLGVMRELAGCFGAHKASLEDSSLPQNALEREQFTGSSTWQYDWIYYNMMPVCFPHLYFMEINLLKHCKKEQLLINGDLTEKPIPLIVVKEKDAAAMVPLKPAVAQWFEMDNENVSYLEFSFTSQVINTATKNFIDPLRFILSKNIFKETFYLCIEYE